MVSQPKSNLRERYIFWHNLQTKREKEKEQRRNTVMFNNSGTDNSSSYSLRFLFEYNCKENKLLKYYTITFKAVVKIEFKE